MFLTTYSSFAIAATFATTRPITPWWRPNLGLQDQVIVVLDFYLRNAVVSGTRVRRERSTQPVKGTRVDTLSLKASGVRCLWIVLEMYNNESDRHNSYRNPWKTEARHEAIVVPRRRLVTLVTRYVWWTGGFGNRCPPCEWTASFPPSKTRHTFPDVVDVFGYLHPNGDDIEPHPR